MAAIGGAGTGYGPGGGNLTAENTNAVPVNLSSLPIYQFDEDMAALRKMIKVAIQTPSEASLEENRKNILRITLDIKKYLEKTYPGKNIPLTTIKIDDVIELVEGLYEGTPGLSMSALRGKLYTVITTEIGPGGTVGERLQRLHERAAAATTKNQLTMIAMATLALVSEVGQYNTNATLSTTFSGKVGGHSRAKKLTRRHRGYRHRRVTRR